MREAKIIILDEKEKAVLEEGYRQGDRHAFRKRCHLILLKSKGHTSLEIASILGCCEMAVNNWVKRFEADGIEGLKTKPGRGGKPILKVETDLEVVRQAVSRNRQRISVARAELVYLLFAGLFTAFEHRRNIVAKIKIRMAVSSGLSGLGEVKISS